MKEGDHHPEERGREHDQLQEAQALLGGCARDLDISASLPRQLRRQSALLFLGRQAKGPGRRAERLGTLPNDPPPANLRPPQAASPVAHPAMSSTNCMGAGLVLTRGRFPRPGRSRAYGP
jgi:hypothetical protein